MKRILLTLVTSLLMSICVHAQSGPHNADSKIIGVVFSHDHSKFLTISYYELALWNADAFELIKVIKFSDLGIALQTFTYSRDVTLKYIFLKTQFSGEILVNMETVQATRIKTNLQITGITAGGMGIGQDAYGKRYVVNFETGQQETVKGFPNCYLSPDGTKLEERGKKRVKTYDLITKQTGEREVVADAPVTEFKTDINAVDRKIVVYDKDNTTKGEWKLVVAKWDFPQLLETQLEKSRVFVLEDNGYRTENGFIYQNHLVCYKLPAGEVIKDLELNDRGEAAARAQEIAHKEQEAAAKKKEEARKAMLANARPGFKEFDGKFTNMSLPFTMDYNSAQGFDISGDPFAYNDVKPRSGSVIFGMGKICSCNDQSSYLIMIRNKSESTDVSNFIILSYRIDGTLANMRNIGATQKDPSGSIRFDFSISGGDCGVNIKGKMTYPNGHTEDKSVSISNCTVP